MMGRTRRLKVALAELGAELSTVQADSKRMAVLLNNRRDRIAELQVELLQQQADLRVTEAENDSLLRALTALTRERVPS